MSLADSYVVFCTPASKRKTIMANIIKRSALSQQNNAPAQHAGDTLELLLRVTPQFIGPDMWPANSPDLNPVDYSIWAGRRSTSIEY